ncbi:hypothetical protein D3C87_1174060 [compost metagenome]
MLAGLEPELVGLSVLEEQFVGTQAFACVVVGLAEQLLRQPPDGEGALLDQHKLSLHRVHEVKHTATVHLLFGTHLDAGQLLFELLETRLQHGCFGLVLNELSNLLVLAIQFVTLCLQHLETVELCLDELTLDIDLVEVEELGKELLAISRAPHHQRMGHSAVQINVTVEILHSDGELRDPLLQLLRRPSYLLALMQNRELGALTAELVLLVVHRDEQGTTADTGPVFRLADYWSTKQDIADLRHEERLARTVTTA